MPSGAYFCTVQAAAGIKFDQSQKKWNGVPFEPRGGFIVRIKFQHTETQKMWNVEFTYDFYEASITQAGTSGTRNCRGSGKPTVMVDREHSSFQCDADLHEHRFNLKTLRFLRYYPIGYLNGDQPDNTPSVEAGICTKIE